MYNKSMENNFGFILNTKEGTVLNIKLVPNSSFNKIIDYTNEFIRIKISAPPIENKANKELISFVSEILKINKSKIKIISGEKSKLKKLLITDTDLTEVTQKIMFMLNSIHKEK